MIVGYLFLDIACKNDEDRQKRLIYQSLLFVSISKEVEIMRIFIIKFMMMNYIKKLPNETFMPTSSN